jgi:hypothetical protein
MSSESRPEASQEKQCILYLSHNKSNFRNSGQKPSGMRIENTLPHTLMEMVMINVMWESATAYCPLLLNVLLNTSQWGHRSPCGGSQLQFQPQKLQATEHVTSIPVNKTFSCYGPALLISMRRWQGKFISLRSYKLSFLYTEADQKLQDVGINTYFREQIYLLCLPSVIRR